VLVADTGPIIAFARIGRLDLLQQVVNELAIPEAVYEEIVIKGKGRGGATEVEQSTWIHQKAVTDRTALAFLPTDLHLGEREAILLAQEFGAQLLIDERRGRKSAMERGLEIIGTLRILAEAKRQSIVDRVKPVLEALVASGYRIDEELTTTFLKEMGEPVVPKP
jgi:predicted nucleic acid-binding protein